MSKEYIKAMTIAALRGYTKRSSCHAKDLVHAYIYCGQVIDYLKTGVDAMHFCDQALLIVDYRFTRIWVR